MYAQGQHSLSGCARDEHRLVTILQQEFPERVGGGGEMASRAARQIPVAADGEA